MKAMAIKLYLLALILLVLDQWTKGIADTRLAYGVPVPVLPVLDITLVYNRGAAFSFLSQAGGWQRWLFTAISSLMSIVLIVWIYRLKPAQWITGVGLSMVLAGALGNLYDRITLGYVIDFISAHYQGRYFPAFNLADSAITVGAGFLILDMWRESRQGTND
jgi:signal peptidase II